MKEEKIYRCLYCYFKSPNLEEVKRHEEHLHGCYRDKVTRTTKSTKPKPTLKESIWFARHLPIRGTNFKIDVLYEFYSDGSYKMFTDDLKYGDHLEIVYDKSIGMYNVKNISKLREEYYRKQSEDVVSDVDALKEFIR
jgi:hypothetical protein